MHARFWGVRGSVPWATPQAIGHGCNTPCIELVNDAGDMLVLDAGSGIVGLSEALKMPRSVPILLTHYHWDHLQGLPFFSPLYMPGNCPTLWAPKFPTIGPEFVEAIFQSPFFPVPYDRLPAPPQVVLIEPGQYTIGSYQVRAIPLNHPGGAFAYRISGTHGDLVYLTDHELGDPAFDEPLEEFVDGAAALVIDAHFTPAESPTHRHWGHSNWAEGAEFAARTKVKRLWLFHHKPGRTDVELLHIESEARRIFEATDVAGEGDTFDV